MKYKQFYSLVFTLLLACFWQINAQEIWKSIDNEIYYQQKKEVKNFKNFPEKYKLYTLNFSGLENQLKGNSKTVKLPNANGVLETFQLKEVFNLAKPLAAKFPNIKSYAAKGVDDPSTYAKISMGSDGFHAVIFSAKGHTLYIDPYTKDNKDFIVYKTTDLKNEDTVFKCEVEEVAQKATFPSFSRKSVNDGNLRTFRIAIVCSGEYAQFHLTNQGVSASATESVKKAAVLSAMNTSMNRVNGIFEKDLSVTMQIVADNDKIIYLDAATDNITDGDPNAMIDEVQTIVDAEIGNANYDIGHIFSVGGDGLAGLGVVCIPGQKARGVTGRSSPIGDPYDIDFVVHEIGHQFGATHTQNNDCQRTNSTAVEPGSASTLMGYAGICVPNVQGQSDDYFHAVSVAQMQNIIQSSGSCATLTSNGNTAPVADAGLDYSIPKSTPFVLKASATDVDGLSTLTYNWEQVDNESATMPPLTTNSVGPMFRSLPSKTVPERYFPELANVISGNSDDWEVLPSVERSLNFSLLVRDNNTSGGATSRDNMLISVTDAIPFEVTSQTTSLTWDAGSTQTITWSKGTSDIAPINCKTVHIKLSTDGGVTFPITLKSNTENDGSESIIVPNNITTEARILVEAADNIFYNVNATNFTIRSTAPTFILTNTSGNVSACNTGNQSAVYTLNLDFINGFTETVTLSATGQPANSSVVFSPASISNDGNVTMTVSNLDGLAANNFSINVVGSSASITQNLEVNLAITASNIDVVTLASPANEDIDISLTERLIWQAEANATSYNVQVATNVSFSNIIIDETISDTFITLFNVDGETNYFWRVKAINSCNEGGFSPVFSFTTERPSYCSSTFTDEAGGSEHILNVTFNSINNSSGNDTTDGYEDFTTINTDVFRETSYTISVTLNTAGFQDHCYVFIDWNKDFIFDKQTERYALGTELDDIGTLTSSIEVPSNAKFGKTTMRVVIEYDDPDNGFGDGACDIDHLTEWGETEDYSITVADPSIDPSIDPNNVSVRTISESCVDQNDGNITVTVQQPAFNYSISIIGNSFNNTRDVNNTSNSTFTSLAPGDYTVCVTTKELNFTQCFEVEILASNPISLKADSSNAKKHQFNITAGTAPFNVYLNNKLVLTTSQKTFEIEPKQGGTLEIKTAKECEGVYKTTIESVLLLKNPVVNSIDLLLPLGTEKNALEAIVFDINGKLIFKEIINVRDNTMSIPFKNYTKGIYILKLPIEAKPIKILKQ